MPISDYFTGQLLLAMPGMGDPRFHKGVVFLCIHDEKGAMGLVINSVLPGLSFGPLLEQLDILPQKDITAALQDRPVFGGGPVEQTRGFVLHDGDYRGADTIVINDQFSLTGTTDGLREIGKIAGPLQTRFILGYAGWEPGQLENELQDNAWMTAPATHDLVFATKPGDQWGKAFAALGVDPVNLSLAAGRA